MRLFGRLVTVGSSPRVRGTVHELPARLDDPRFIPACAGNGNPGTGSTPRLLAVHPRVCGERCRRGRGPRATAGSSPRVRGTGSGAALQGIRRRFIPACAGNGFASGISARAVAGSSPRVRGTGDAAGRETHVLRFIPACAGNGSTRTVSTARPTVHPRVCGERGSGRGTLRQYGGSSPRVRGTVLIVEAAVLFVRFIPACAGNGFASGNLRRAVAGSSPRVRGTGDAAGRETHVLRFIPACAGNGSTRTVSTARPTVHPRVCGERGSGRGTLRQYGGSSPRVRGTVLIVEAAVLFVRFIPRVCGERMAERVRLALADGSSPRVRGTGRGAD